MADTSAQQLDPKLKEVYDRVVGTLPPHQNPRAEFTDDAAIASTPQAAPKVDGTPVPSPQEAVNKALGSQPIKAQQPNITLPSESPTPKLVTEEVTDTHKMPDAGLTPAKTEATPTTPEAPTNEVSPTQTPVAEKTDDKKSNEKDKKQEGPVVTHNDNVIHGYIAPKPHSASSIALYVFIGIAFVIVYSFVWLKLFNLPLPFFGS